MPLCGCHIATIPYIPWYMLVLRRCKLSLCVQVMPARKLFAFLLAKLIFARGRPGVYALSALYHKHQVHSVCGHAPHTFGRREETAS